MKQCVSDVSRKRFGNKVYTVTSIIHGEERVSCVFADNLVQAKKQIENSGLLATHEITGIRESTKSDLDHIIRIMYEQITNLLSRGK